MERCPTEKERTDAAIRESNGLAAARAQNYLAGDDGSNPDLTERAKASIRNPDMALAYETVDRLRELRAEHPDHEGMMIMDAMDVLVGLMRVEASKTSGHTVVVEE